MKNQRRALARIFVTLISFLVLSGFAFGQDIEKGTVEATGLVGLISGIGTHSSFAVNGGSAVTDRIFVSGELMYIPLGSESVSVLGVSSDFSAKAIEFNVGAQYQLKRFDKITPYAGAGLGVLHTSSNASVSTSFGGLNLSSGSSENDFYANLGGGARYYVNERWGFKPELMIFAGSNTFVRLSGGIFFQFGK